MPDDAYVHAADLSSLADGEMRQAEAGGHQILLARVGDAVHATTAFCTHLGAPLATGVLDASAPGGPTVVCPWHHACFRLDTGACTEPPAADALRAFPVRLDGDRVLVAVPPDADAHGEGVAYRESDGAAPPAVPPAVLADTADDRLVVVLGAGAAGQAAVEALRGTGYRGRLALVTQETHAPYDRTALSKGFLAGTLEAGALPLRDGGFYDARGIELWTDREVTRLDPATRTLTFRAGEPVVYDACLVATGGTPRRLRVPGADLDGVHVLRSWADAEALVRSVREAARAVVVGGSFIGMEAASALAGQGAAVTVVDRAAVPFERTLGPDVGRVFQSAAEEKGVAFVTGATVAEIAAEGDRLAVVLAAGERLPADVVVLGVGVTPATAFLDGAPFRDAETGALTTDATLRLADGLYAAGDVARVPDAHGGEPARIEHWRLAQQHGRHAAHAMLAAPDPTQTARPFEGVPFFWTGQFGLSLRYVGHAEAWDDVVVDGSLAERSFVAYYVAGDRVLAAAAMGRDRDAAALERLVARGAAPSAADVRAGFDALAALAAVSAPEDG